jgi:hypothetical protein
MYTANIPALPPVVSAQAQALNALAAPAIQAGTPLNTQDVLAAQLEAQARQNMRLHNDMSVNNDELAEAEIRAHAVISSHAQQQFPGAGAPAWFGPAMQAALAPLQNQMNVMQNQMNALQNQTNVLQNQMIGMQNQMNEMQNHMNFSERRNVARVYNSIVREENVPLQQLVDNNGVYPNGFPADAAALKHLSSAQVNVLLQAYGIATHGTLPQRKKRLANFIGFVLV